MAYTHININSNAINDRWTLIVDLVINNRNEPRSLRLELKPNPKKKDSSDRSYKLLIPIKALPFLRDTLQSASNFQELLSENNQQHKRRRQARASRQKKSV